MRKKLLCTISAVAMLSGLLVVGAAAPALAAPPTDVHNFLPDDTEKTGNSSIGTVLSDRFDGVDQTVHLSAVATVETTRVQWRLCAAGTVGTDGTETLTQAQFDACTIIIGEDSTPTTPAGNPPANVDEAYEFNWDIPGTEDGATRDIVAAACIGAGEDVFNDAVPAADESNCVVDVENQVQLEDAQTGITQTPAGEITSFCTVDVDGPGVANNECNIGGLGAGTPAQVAARFQPFVHGDNVPNQGFTFRARVSDDATDLSWMNGPGDAVTDPNLQADFNLCTQIFAGTNFREFECSVSDAETADNAEMHLTLIEEFGGGTGFCSAVFCQLDSHYIVSNARRAETVVATFEDPDLTEAENCAAPDDAETNNLDDGETVLFCVTDQFGQPFNTSITFESTGPSSAGFDGTGDCTAQNHDLSADGVDEHCDGTTGPDGIAAVNAENPDDWDPGEPALRGVQTITACVENEPIALDPLHGCAAEPAALKDTVAKTWESDATVVRLVFGDKTANCFTGPTFKENLVGDTDSLKACTYDSFNNPTPTTGTNDGFLEWSIDTGADDDVDTQYAGPPPSETDADGEAVGVIEALNQGTDFPEVCLRADITGNTLSCDSVQKNVRNVPGAATSAISIRHRKGPHRFTGRVTSSSAACVSGRNVVLKRVKPGRDRTIGTDATNAAGKYSIRHKKTRVAKRYYTKVRSTSTCGGARSRTLRRR